MTSTQARSPQAPTRATETISVLMETGDFSLQVLNGPHKGQEYPLERELLRIGRADWCELVLTDDHWVSYIHCECWLDEQGVRLRDLNSRNGLLLDGNRVFDAYLRDGAIFQVGHTKLQLISHEKQREIAVQYSDDSGLLVGKSPKMRTIFSMLQRLSQTEVTTLLTGETGTGKTSVAQAIHDQSKRSAGPFVVVNCGALPENLIEAQLFGYEKGAFTGADKRHIGFFEQAHGGTLLLDEIAELPLELQPKLLDVLERRKIRRLGSHQDLDVDFRLLLATHKDLEDEMRQGRFREDLFFRLSVFTIEIPPLRQRPEDIPLLTSRLLESISTEGTITITPPALGILQRELWPGNIRQLRNILQRALFYCSGLMIGVSELRQSLNPHSVEHSLDPDSHGAPAQPSRSSRLPRDGEMSHIASLLPQLPLSDHCEDISLKGLLESIERAMVVQALEESQYNAQEAAKLLGISFGWLYNRARKYKLPTKKSAS